MRNAARILRDEARDFARLMARDMGKPVKDGMAEAQKCALACDFYADNASAFSHSSRVATDASRSYVALEPLGVVLAVMPWNFPFWQCSVSPRRD